MNKTHGQNGFTLIELLVVMVIMVILFGISAPLLMNLGGANNVEYSARELQSTLIQARSLAARYNTNYSVIFSYWGYEGEPAYNPTTHAYLGASKDWSGSTSNGYAICGHEPDGDFPSSGQEDHLDLWQFDTAYTTSSYIRAPNGNLYKCIDAGQSLTSKTPTFSGSPVKENDFADANHDASGNEVQWELVPEDTSYSANLVGETNDLKENTKFMALTSRDSSGRDCFDKDYNMGPSQYPKHLAKFRITFTPTGEAHFIIPWANSEDDDGWQTLIITDSNVIRTESSNPNYHDDDELPELSLKQGVFLRVMVNKYTGDVKIMGK